MEAATFRKWLSEQGCRFDHRQHEKRAHVPTTVTVHREGRSAELPLVGSRKRLDPEEVRRICERLGLDWSQLPGPKSRV
jgi:hypothetical protein